MGKRGRAATKPASSATHVEPPGRWPWEATLLGPAPRGRPSPSPARVLWRRQTPCFSPLDSFAVRKVGVQPSASTTRLPQNNKPGTAAPQWDHPPPTRLVASQQQSAISARGGHAPPVRGWHLPGNTVHLRGISCESNTQWFSLFYSRHWTPRTATNWMPHGFLFVWMHRNRTPIGLSSQPRVNW